MSGLTAPPRMMIPSTWGGGSAGRGKRSSSGRIRISSTGKTPTTSRIAASDSASMLRRPRRCRLRQARKTENDQEVAGRKEPAEELAQDEHGMCSLDACDPSCGPLPSTGLAVAAGGQGCFMDAARPATTEGPHARQDRHRGARRSRRLRRDRHGGGGVHRHAGPSHRQAGHGPPLPRDREGRVARLRLSPDGRHGDGAGAGLQGRVLGQGLWRLPAPARPRDLCAASPGSTAPCSS